MSVAIHADDLSAWVTKITSRFEDADNLVPDGSTMAAQVASVAPDILTEINLAAGTTFGDGTVSGTSTRLPESVMTIAAAGIIAEVLLNAYRQLDVDEKEWVDAWRARFDTYLGQLRDGSLRLVDTSADDTRSTAAVAGGARVFGKAREGEDASDWVNEDDGNRVDIGSLF